jgi:hypothetical protein
MEGKSSRRTYNIIGIVLTAVVIVAAAVFLVYLFNATNEETEAVFKDDSVEFTGMYGISYAYADIKGVSLEDSIPAVGKKLDGSGLGDVMKGDWDVEGMGKCRLFVMSKTGPYIVMDTSGGYAIISYKDPEKTKALYESLSEKLSG